MELVLEANVQSLFKLTCILRYLVSYARSTRQKIILFRLRKMTSLKLLKLQHYGTSNALS